jgi:hypothetical protein
MRNLIVVSTMLLFGLAVPQPARAAAAPSASGASLSVLLQRLDLRPISPAQAAECKDEGEVCKTNAECCSGLECSGDPQPTCQPQD